jgi:L-threonylcarbamoyladenylate synthase
MTDDELSLALSALSRGAVVAVATETLFGLLADPQHPGALDALFALKGRQAEKGVALLVPGKDSWRELVDDVPPLAESLADHFWPGPLTIVLPARPGLDPRLTVDGTVGARWPGPSDAARLVAAFGGALTATSANRSGAPACATSEDVRAAFPAALAEGALELVPGTAPGGEPSTLVVVTGRQVRVVRSGRIRESDLLSLVPTSPLR